MSAALRHSLAPLAALLGLFALWQLIGTRLHQNYLPPLSAVLPLLGTLFPHRRAVAGDRLVAMAAVGRLRARARGRRAARPGQRTGARGR
ncbi:MAG: hypothetical protein WDO24_25450 [Pseudomonadota bacterium]